MVTLLKVLNEKKFKYLTTMCSTTFLIDERKLLKNNNNLSTTKYNPEK